MSDEDTALDAMAREELGIDPEKLGGSPAVAAVACFVPFTVGAPASRSRSGGLWAWALSERAARHLCTAPIPRAARACGCVWPSSTARRVSV
jgi:hypothetical protein